MTGKVRLMVVVGFFVFMVFRAVNILSYRREGGCGVGGGDIGWE